MPFMIPGRSGKIPSSLRRRRELPNPEPILSLSSVGTGPSARYWYSRHGQCVDRDGFAGVVSIFVVAANSGVRDSKNFIAFRAGTEPNLLAIIFAADSLPRCRDSQRFTAFRAGAEPNLLSIILAPDALTRERSHAEANAGTFVLRRSSRRRLLLQKREKGLREEVVKSDGHAAC